MEYSIDHGPTFSVLNLEMQEGESLRAEPKSMLCMSTGFDIKAIAGGQFEKTGAVSSMKSFMTGESFFTTIYTAKRDQQKLTIAPEFNGEILPLDVSSSSYFLTQGAFLASTDQINIKVSYAGFKGLMAKKGLYLMEASGDGLLFLSSHGAIIRKTLEEEERIVIDNSYVLAFENSVHYELVKATAGLKDSVLSGEGLVNRYTGPGEVIYQTRAQERKSGLVTGLLNVFT